MRDYFAALAARTIQPEIGVRPRRRVRWEELPEPAGDVFDNTAGSASPVITRQPERVETDHPSHPTRRQQADANLSESEPGTPRSRRRRLAPARPTGDEISIAESASIRSPVVRAGMPADQTRIERVQAGTRQQPASRRRTNTDGRPSAVAPSRGAERPLHVPVRISVRSREPETSEPVVRIHIGRVDVRAVTVASPTPSAPRASKRTLMSLDEYVQKRDRDAS